MMSIEAQNVAAEASAIRQVKLVRSLLEQDLLDELILLVHPVVAGNGKRLFKDGDSLKRLKLLSSKTTRTGTVILTYQPLQQ